MDTNKKGNMFEQENFTREEPKKEFEAKPAESFRKPKSPHKILNIINNEFVLVNSAGHGIRMPIPHEFKNSKIGDTINL